MADVCGECAITSALFDSLFAAIYKYLFSKKPAISILTTPCPRKKRPVAFLL